MDSERRHKEKHKKSKKKKHKKHKKRRSSTSSSASGDEWVEKCDTKLEKEPENIDSLKRDSWMTDLTYNIPTTSNEKLKSKARENEERDKRLDSYDPSKCARELNPYWKDGGDGLPSFSRATKFMKPETHDAIKKPYNSRPQSSGDWRKKSSHHVTIKHAETKEPELKLNLSDKELNELAARVLKAEIMGNTKLHNELKLQLENVREYRKENPETIKSEKHDVIMSVTDSKGQTNPIQKRADEPRPSSSRSKKQKVETHFDGERVRYFGDDDKYTLKEMFEREKLTSGYDDEASFVKISSRIKNADDDVVNLFKDTSFDPKAKELEERNKTKALKEHKTLQNCTQCIDSDKFNKHAVIHLGNTVYISLPPYQSLTEGHCFLAPIRHVSCSTQLDEDEWSEMQAIRKKLGRMFAARNQITVFFESAKDLHKYPHMIIECVPLPEQEGSLAPMYFKKAILECEKEWSNNRKLIELKQSNVRRAIPKGLAYFAVEFDSEPGFAHVIEDRRDFPRNFAQEIIGGLLDLHHSVWRKPQYENASELTLKVNHFQKMWTSFNKK